MSLTAEQSAALVEDTLETTDVPETPASGEQAKPELETSTETTTETSEETNTEEGKSDKPDDKEKAKEQTPDEKRAWRAVTIAKNEQVKVAKAKQQLSQHVERVRSYETQLEHRERANEQRTVELDAREAEVKPLLEALKSRDLNKLVALGFDYDAFTRDRLDANTPEGMARRAAARVEALEKERADEKKQRDEAEAARARVNEQRQDAHTLVAIVDSAEGAKDFPSLQTWTPERIAQEGLEAKRNHFQATKRMPTYEMVLRHLEKIAKQEQSTTLQQRRSANPSDAGSAGKVDPKGNSGSPNTPSLNQRDAAVRLSPPREKTEEEIDEECKAMLRGLKR